MKIMQNNEYKSSKRKRGYASVESYNIHFHNIDDGRLGRQCMKSWRIYRWI